jgi:multidrug efflux system outer membrane protein
VEDALTDLHLRADAAQAQTRAVDAARQYRQLTEAQYRTGLITYLQVIDSNRSVLTNELTQAQILYQRMISTVLLIKALGGGWDSQTSGATQPDH